MERARVHGVNRSDVVVGAALDGDRDIHQPEASRPSCPHCATRLDPGRVLAGWSPGPRRRHHWCLGCDCAWAEVPDPTVLVTALAGYWLARNGHGPVGVEAAVARLEELHLPVPA